LKSGAKVSCGTVVNASGPRAAATAQMAGITLPVVPRKRYTFIFDAAEPLEMDLPLTIDPVEHRGFEYHAGATFTLYAAGVRGELGSGGRYLAGNGGTAAGAGEPATGFTLFTDTLLRALPRPAQGRRLFVPAGTTADRAANLRAEGWITVAGLDDGADARAEAQRLGCTHWLHDGRPAPIGEA